MDVIKLKSQIKIGFLFISAIHNNVIHAKYIFNKENLIVYSYYDKSPLFENEYSIIIYNFCEEKMYAHDSKNERIINNININKINRNQYSIGSEKKLITTSEITIDGVNVLEQIWTKSIFNDNVNKIEKHYIGDFHDLLDKYLPNRECRKLLSPLFKPNEFDNKYCLVLKKIDQTSEKEKVYFNAEVTEVNLPIEEISSALDIQDPTLIDLLEKHLCYNHKD